ARSIARLRGSEGQPKRATVCNSLTGVCCLLTIAPRGTTARLAAIEVIPGGSLLLGGELDVLLRFSLGHTRLEGLQARLQARQGRDLRAQLLVFLLKRGDLGSGLGAQGRELCIRLPSQLLDGLDEDCADLVVGH